MLFFIFLFGLESRFFGVFFTPFLEEEILDYLAHGPVGFVETEISVDCYVA